MKLRAGSLRSFPKVVGYDQEESQSLIYDTQQHIEPQSRFPQKLAIKLQSQMAQTLQFERVQSQLPQFSGQKRVSLINKIDVLFANGMKCIRTSRIDEGLNHLQAYIENQFAQKGKETIQFQNDFTNLIQQVCQIAMAYLNEPSNYKLSIVILLWADQQTHYEKYPTQKCHILNNLGCAFRRMGKLSQAYNAIGKALELVQQYEDMPNKAVTYLNLTAILSQMGLHDKALVCARSGVKESQRDLAIYTQSNNQDQIQYTEKARYVGIAIHNVAAELEALEELKEATAYFKKAYEFTKEHVGQHDPLYKKFHDSFLRSKQKSQVIESNSLIQSKLPDRDQQKIKGKFNRVSKTQIQKALFGFQKQSTQVNEFQTDESMMKQSPITSKSQHRPVLRNNFVSVDEFKSSINESSNLIQNQTDSIQFEQWTDSELDDQQDVPTQIQIKIPQDKSKEKQLTIKKYSLPNKDRTVSLQEEMIIKEVEGNMSVLKIPVKQKRTMSIQQQNPQCKRSSEVVKTDDLKIKKLQNFVKKKLTEFKQRQLTKDLVVQLKSERDPIKEQKAALIIQKSLKFMIQQNSNEQKTEYLMLRQSSIEVIRIDLRGNDINRVTKIPLSQRLYRFKFEIRTPDYMSIKLSLRLMDKKLKSRNDLNADLVIETEDFYRSIGQIGLYIQQLEDTFSEDYGKLASLKALQMWSIHFLNISKFNRQTIVQLKIDNFKQLEQSLRKLGPYIQDLIRIQGLNKIIVLGINDFDYNSAQNEDEKKVIIKALKPTDKNMIQNITKLQSWVRGKLQRHNYHCLRSKKRKVIQRMLLKTVDMEYIFVNQVAKNKTRIIYCVVCSLKQKTNDIEILSTIVRYMGQVRAQNFFEIFRLVTHTAQSREYAQSYHASQIFYTDEAQYWVQRKNDMKHKKGQEKPSTILRSVSIIQRNVRKFLYKCLASLNLEYSKRQFQMRNMSSRKKIILRRAMIYRDKGVIKAYLTSFILYTEYLAILPKSDHIASPKDNKRIEQQSIQITTKPLEHLQSSDKIVSYSYKLYQVIGLSELLTIANQMVETSKIVKGRHNILKLEIQPFDQVMTQLRNENRKKNGTSTFRKEETLNDRINFNQQKMFSNKNQSIIEFTHFGQLNCLSNYLPVRKDILVPVEDHSYLRMIQNQVRRFLKLQQKTLMGTKQLNKGIDQQISNYIKNFMPTTDYGFEQNLQEEIVVPHNNIFQRDQGSQMSTFIKKGLSLVFDQSIKLNDSVISKAAIDNVDQIIEQMSLLSLKDQSEVQVGHHTSQEDMLIKRLQSMFQIRSNAMNLKLYKDSQNNEVLLKRFLETRNQRLIEVKYFLIKKTDQLKILVQELTTLDGEQNVVEKSKTIRKMLPPLKSRLFYIDLNYLKDIYQVIENLKRNEQQSLLRANLSQVMRDFHKNLKMIEQIRSSFKDFINILHCNLHITYILTNMHVKLLNINIPLEEVQHQPQKHLLQNLQFVEMQTLLKAVVKIQQNHRLMVSREMYLLKLSKKNNLKEKNKHIGKFVKRAFLNIGGDQYIVNVFQKENKRQSGLTFTYELIEYVRSLKQSENVGSLEQTGDKKKRIRGYYQWDPSLMLNIGEVPLHDYVMGLIYINYRETKVMDPKYIDQREIKFRDHIYEQYSKSEIVDKQIPSSPKNLTKIVDQLIESSPNKLKDDVPIVEDEIPEQLVFQNEAKSKEGKSLLFNVVYSGTQTLKDKRRTQQQIEENKTSKDNTLKIEVDLKNVRKLYPALSTTKGDMMKIIGENLTEGIRINQYGQILVDHTKISQQFLNVVENNIQTEASSTQQHSRTKLPFSLKNSDRSDKPVKKEILVKKTTMDSVRKYLVVIHYMEMRIKRILKASKDEVFEDYELLYQVYATNLNDKSEPAIIWELSPQQAEILSHKRSKLEIAAALSKRLRIINRKFIYLIENIEDLDLVSIADKNIFLLLEQSITPIQNYFRNTAFKRNYKIYKNFIKGYRKLDGTFMDSVASHSIEEFKSTKIQFIVFCYEDLSQQVQVKAWTLNKFIQCKIEIPKNEYLSMYNKNRNECIKAFLHFIEVSDALQLSFTYPKYEAMMQCFKAEQKIAKNQAQEDKFHSKIYNSQLEVRLDSEQQLESKIILQQDGSQ